ncbi:MAG: carbamoyltransferase HypF [Acidobacteriaceae bacterium]|jgi:hydrogenase maturation protein HypF
MTTTLPEKKTGEKTRETHPQSTAQPVIRRVRVEVRGIVQGVGFRPYIYRLALRNNLSGIILNSESGVSIEIQGPPPAIDAFLHALPREAPPLARLTAIAAHSIDCRNEPGFTILPSSHSGNATTLIPPDIATCADCAAELLDPHDRRYRYPFINCTNCGPRFTIVHSLPYDRAQTSMAHFRMCPACQAEYHDPLNRRFHAQPNACWDCGPQLELVDSSGAPHPANAFTDPHSDQLAETVRHLKLGSIVAIKGLGGFHLAVDAANPAAVAELRLRKRRVEKPFAVMVPSLAAARRIAVVTESDAALLESPQRPIVLLPKLDHTLDALAPDTKRLGLFLPYTPLHHLLFASTGLSALVMTSANLSDEPIAIDNAEALARLARIADFFLLHNRDILLRADDSVVQTQNGRTQFIRRSRGYVPSPIELASSAPPILAVGGELKNVICLSRGRYAFPGQHIGDLESLTAFEFFRESIEHMQQVLEVAPEVIAYDLHPAYLSTLWAKRQRHTRLIGVQHHHAHIASCMAENRLSGQVIGIALDGTGFGPDGAAWGGEILVAGLDDFTRAAHLAYVAMPGNAQAIHQPWRMAVSHLVHAFGDDWRTHLPVSTLSQVFAAQITLVEQMLRTGINSPLTSSCGRLFDAVTALILQRTRVTYEAQAAIALEACCDPRTSLGAYPFAIVEGPCLQLDARPLFTAIAEDLRRGIAPGVVSRRFHAGLAAALAGLALRIAQETGLDRVCLSGGVFLNRILSEALEAQLANAGLAVYTQTQVPPGDGGLSLGQLAIAASRVTSSHLIEASSNR